MFTYPGETDKQNNTKNVLNTRQVYTDEGAHLGTLGRLSGSIWVTTRWGNGIGVVR